MHRHDEERIRHLHGFVNSFVIRSKRERYHAFLSNSKRRSEILNRLNHYCATDFDLRYRVDTPPNFSAKLRAYILSDNADLDDRFMDPEDALELVKIAHFGSVVSLFPGKLVPVKPEAPSTICWFHRPD